MAVNVNRSSFVCPYCPGGDYVAPSEELFLSHIRLAHSFDPNFQIQCSSEGCSRTFRNFRTYQNHRRTHRPRVEQDDSSSIVLGSTGSDDLNLASWPHDPSSNNLQMYTAKWILKISETRNLTRASTLSIIEDVSELIKFVGQSLRVKVCHAISTAGVNLMAIKDIEGVFHSSVLNPFDGLMSFYQQFQYYRENFNLIVSYLNGSHMYIGFNSQ